VLHSSILRSLPFFELRSPSLWSGGPTLAVEGLDAAGVSLARYPLSAFRAMSAAAATVFAAIRAGGTQARVVPEMQTRAELSDVLDDEARERQADLRASGTT
jgi:2-methylisocitrate lyase-like PEP mutase family enzyme